MALKNSTKKSRAPGPRPRSKSHAERYGVCHGEAHEAREDGVVRHAIAAAPAAPPPTTKYQHNQSPHQSKPSVLIFAQRSARTHTTTTHALSDSPRVRYAVARTNAHMYSLT